MRPHGGFLAATSVIDWTHPAVRSCAQQLEQGADSVAELARRCYDYVRDSITHTVDAGVDEIACSASEVLELGSGFCYAKSHLLAALLRANGIPAGICYQRLSIGTAGAPYCLHGLNAIYLPSLGWYRVDARGNRPGLDACFDPPREHLAYAANGDGERNFDSVLAEPLPLVVERLRACRNRTQLLAALPDMEALPEVVATEVGA